MTRHRFEAAQDRLGIRLHAGSGFALYALPQQFNAGVKLLADAMLHPALPDKAFTKRQKVLERYYKGRVNSPKFKFGRVRSGRLCCPRAIRHCV